MNIFQRALKAGLSCVPCNGKVPSLKTWREYMKYPATLDVAANWTGNIEIVCGRVSGGLVCIDFDIKNGDRYHFWVYSVSIVNPKILSKLYVETTPSGGYHVCYRSNTDIHNMVLAKNKEGKGMIEVRGEGGLFVCAPSKGYTKSYGKLGTLETLSEDEESILLAVAESFNEYEKEEYKPKHNVEVTGDTVFNRYDSSVDPIPLLIQHGWKVVFNRGEKVYLRRPGKKEGFSATWNVVPNRFYCFSTSTIFKSHHVYKPSAVYTILEHGGDFRAACKALGEIEKSKTVNR
jgi:hypothetical protein